MSSMKAVKNVTKPAKTPKPVVVEVVESDKDEGSETEMSADEDDDEEEDDEDEDEDDEEDKVEDDKKSDKKEKPKKLSFDEIINEIAPLDEEEQTVSKEIEELLNNVMQKRKRINAIRKLKTKLFGLFPKAYLDGMSQARKEKKKRTNAAKSGILRDDPVPPLLINFLGLPENATASRPRVFSLLNDKFKALKLKEGQVTILDKKTAKLFGFEEGHRIEFRDCQKFLADIYRAHNAKATEVSL